MDGAEQAKWHQALDLLVKPVKAAGLVGTSLNCKLTGEKRAKMFSKEHRAYLLKQGVGVETKAEGDGWTEYKLTWTVTVDVDDAFHPGRVYGLD